MRPNTQQTPDQGMRVGCSVFDPRSSSEQNDVVSVCWSQASAMFTTILPRCISHKLWQKGIGGNYLDLIASVPFDAPIQNYWSGLFAQFRWGWGICMGSSWIMLRRWS